MRKILRLWPLLVYGIIAILNIDAIIIVLSRVFHSCGLVFMIAATIGTAELIYQFWFWGWMIDIFLHLPRIRDEIKFGKESGQELKMAGIISKLKSHAKLVVARATTSENHIVVCLKNGRHVFAGSWAAIPIPGCRLSAIIFCGVFKSRRGILAVVLGNIVHIAIAVSIWSVIWHLVF